MTAYLIADVKVTDNGWVPEYAASVHDIVHKHSSKYLARSGVADGYAIKKHRHAAEVMQCASEIMIKQGRSLPVEYWADPF
jgi:uncharacterized protein (DUF1330 family)